jgi:rare lipoprotein A
MALMILRALVLSALLLPVSMPASGAPPEEGLASWYGGKFHGRLTSNGEVFDTNTMTAAHKELPFDSLVKVTDLDNGRSTVVRINDRGPFVEGRIIDLSRAAAEELDMVGRGVARVRLEVVGRAVSDDRYAIQAGAYGDGRNAERIRARIAGAGLRVVLEPAGAGVTRVLVPGLSGEEVKDALSRLEALGFRSCLVKKEKQAPSAQAPAAARSTSRGDGSSDAPVDKSSGAVN